MKNDAQKNILLLALTGLVFVMVNMAVVMGIRIGQIAPVDNVVLWGAFAVLNVLSLLWATSLLGLQPMVVAVAYAVGGFLAFRGVRLMPDVNVAEIATAGATYGAFGALVVGNATTKVRLAFFTRRQVPFVFMIVALLLLDGLLNSRVSTAGWTVIANALILPFALSGVVIGLVWMVLVRVHAGRAVAEKEPEIAEDAEAVTGVIADDEEMTQLMFSVPESAEVAESMEAVALTPDSDVVDEDVPEAPVGEMESREVDPVEDDSSSGDFFPLEIDTGEEALPQENDSNLMDVAAMIAESAPEFAVEAVPAFEETNLLAEREPPPSEPRTVLTRSRDWEATPSHGKDIIALAEESPVSDSDPEPVEKQDDEPASESKKEKVGSRNWLRSHMDLLNKLK